MLDSQEHNTLHYSPVAAQVWLASSASRFKPGCGERAGLRGAVPASAARGLAGCSRVRGGASAGLGGHAGEEGSRSGGGSDVRGAGVVRTQAARCGRPGALWDSWRLLRVRDRRSRPLVLTWRPEPSARPPPAPESGIPSS